MPAIASTQAELLVYIYISHERDIPQLRHPRDSDIDVDRTPHRVRAVSVLPINT